MKTTQHEAHTHDHTTDFNQLLKSNGLKVTKPRLRVLEVISDTKTAITQPESNRAFCAEIDRVTVYRILASYEDQ